MRGQRESVEGDQVSLKYFKAGLLPSKIHFVPDVNHEVTSFFFFFKLPALKQNRNERWLVPLDGCSC